ncbi:MAG: hypothetical protein ACRDNZ_08980, partial [Streptosporangiaceae bacterium]
LAAQLTGVTLRQDPAVSPGTVEMILGSSFSSLAPQADQGSATPEGTQAPGLPPGTPSASPTSSPGGEPSLANLAEAFGGITGSANCQSDAGAFAP